jgi:hypothetical protein
MIARARRSRSCWSGSAIEVWRRMNNCFIVPLQTSILIEENDDGETALSLPVPLQLLHLRLDHQVYRFMGCDCHIEVYFRVIKQACRVEALRLQTPQRIFNAIAVYLIIAWRLHMLTMVARQHPDIPCDHVLSDEEWQTIYIMKQQRPPPKQPPTLRESTRMLAMLGGFLARKGDGEPGTKTIWVGYINLIGYIKAIRQMAALTVKECV